ncbi:MAG TPA: hypothetical protein VHG93_13790 [Longimicrobium sp.]|nr:hypothetical protein [Longimicrobium sp.]
MALALGMGGVYWMVTVRVTVTTSPGWSKRKVAVCSYDRTSAGQTPPPVCT